MNELFIIPSYVKILYKIVKKSNGEAKLVKVPKDKRHTQKSLKRLEKKICVQIDSNKTMRKRSYVKALIKKKY